MGRARKAPTYVSHQVDVYGAWLHVTRTRAGWKSIRLRVGSDIPKKIESLGLTSRVHRSDGEVHLAVFLDKRLGDVGLVEVASHEAAHACGMLFDSIGASYDGESEPFAYLVGWMTSYLWLTARDLAKTAS